MPRNVRTIRAEGIIAYVPLTKGYEAVIDASDAHLVNKWNWCALVTKRKDGSVRSVYAARKERSSGMPTTILMHRVISKDQNGIDIDHIDCNGLNNRKSNLRKATKSQNQHNQRISGANKSGVKGVRWHKASQKWVAQIECNGRRHHLGCYASISDAAGAYASASASFHGEFGRTA
jgi:hypothetical protein